MIDLSGETEARDQLKFPSFLKLRWLFGFLYTFSISSLLALQIEAIHNLSNSRSLLLFIQKHITIQAIIDCTEFIYTMLHPRVCP